MATGYTLESLFRMLRKSKNDLQYIGEMRNARFIPRMSHLACFSAGMFALEAAHDPDLQRRHVVLQLAENLADTCHESYIRSETKIGPEYFYFDENNEATVRGESSGYNSSSYLLRPEVIEGFFYLWRTRRNPKYKEWVWDAIVAIEQYCRISTGGYSGLKNVYKASDGHDDIQQSFFLAETLKYAYLTFDDDALPLSEWVFNTEAHPFRIENGPLEENQFLPR